MTGAPPRVFISYSHETVEHQERVLSLADRLRADGVDAEVDQYNAAPPEGWPLWCEQQIDTADIVLMICTETYHRRVKGDEQQGKGLGVVWEARIIRQLIYDAGTVSNKFVPVLFSDTSPEQIPTPVKGWTRYVVDTDDGYEELYRRLTAQPRQLRPALGKIRPMPTRRRQWRLDPGHPPEPEASLINARGWGLVMPERQYAIVVRAAESGENICFIARPFRSDFDAIYDAIQVAAVRCNLKPCTTLDFRDDKDFTEKFLKTIASARLVIAVCSPVTTGSIFIANDNVMYELGIAHTLGKKTIILTADTAHRPLDINNRVFSTYSAAAEDHQNNINIIERAIKTALAGPADFLRDKIDSAWEVERTQLSFAKRAFWDCFSQAISKIDKLFEDFVSFEEVVVVPCRSQLDEMLGRDPEASLAIRSVFLTQWSSALTYYDNVILPHIHDLQSQSENGIIEKFHDMSQLSECMHLTKLLNEAESIWRILITTIINFHQSIERFRELATFRNVITKYAENQESLFEQFNNLDVGIRAINKKTALLLSKFRKIFARGD